MTKLKVNSCSECPFRVIDYNPDACGHDTLEYCNLWRNVRKFDSSNSGIIDVYSQFEEDEVFIQCSYCQSQFDADDDCEFDESQCCCASINPSEAVVPELPLWCPLRDGKLTIEVVV